MTKDEAKKHYRNSFGNRLDNPAFLVTRDVLIDAGYTRYPSHALARHQHKEEWMRPRDPGYKFPRWHIVKPADDTLYYIHYDRQREHGWRNFGSVYVNGYLVEIEKVRLWGIALKHELRTRPHLAGRIRKRAEHLEEVQRQLKERYAILKR